MEEKAKNFLAYVSICTYLHWATNNPFRKSVDGKIGSIRIITVFYKVYHIFKGVFADLLDIAPKLLDVASKRP